MAFLFGNQKVLKELANLRQAVQETKAAAEAAQSAAEAAKNAVEDVKDIGLHTGSDTVEGLESLRQAIQEAKEAAEAIQSTDLHTGFETIEDTNVLSSDKTEVSTDIVTESVSGAVVVEVMDNQTDFINDNLLYVSADVKMPSGKKIHIVFSNPQTLGMFEVYDKIRVKQKGSKWEFIEHIP